MAQSMKLRYAHRASGLPSDRATAALSVRFKRVSRATCARIPASARDFFTGRPSGTNIETRVSLVGN
jgi:hypothetical protein